MCASKGRRELLRDPARPGVRPGTAGRSHIQRLDVERGEAEWVLPKEAMEIVIDEDVLITSEELTTGLLWKTHIMVVLKKWKLIFNKN